MTRDKLRALPPADRARIRENAAVWRDNGTAAQKQLAADRLSELDAIELEDVGADTEALKVYHAFVAQPPSPADVVAIRALLDHPASTAEELSLASGWAGNKWHEQFGRMCRKREASLWAAADAPARGARAFSGILAELDSDGNRFTMKPCAIAGFRALGIAAALPAG
ncbi:MAG: hypothetical protein RQ833_06025 [Sphingomonadaceae bacterium]|nr:hypothetical protein [Sphingomonadaceae bacterium]